MHLRGIIFAALLLTIPHVASADMYSFMGFNAETIGQGGAMTAGASGAAGTFYNPAGIGKNKAQEQEISYTWAKPVLRIDREPNSAVQNFLADGQGTRRYDIIAYKEGVNEFQENRAERVPLIRGLNIGIVMPLAENAEDAKASLGVGVYVPQGPILTQRVNSPETPYFVEFDDRTQRIIVNTGVGVDITDDIRVGAGASLLMKIDVSSDIFVPFQVDVNELISLGSGTNNGSPINARVDPFATVKLPPAISPTAGVQWDISDKISVGATYRHEVKAAMEAEASISIAPEGRPVRLPVEFSSQSAFTPSQAALGTQFEPIEGLRISADATWSQWSNYRPPVAEFSVSNLRTLVAAILDSNQALGDLILGQEICFGQDGECITIPTRDELVDLTPTGVSQSYDFEGFRDIISPRVGVAYDVNPDVTVMGGYFYRPSIISPEGVRVFSEFRLHGMDDGLTRRELNHNTLDNDQHGFSMGTTYHYKNLSVSVTGMYVHLSQQTVEKPSDLDPANDDMYDIVDVRGGSLNMSYGYPGYTYGGFVLGGMAQVSLAF